MDVFDALIAWRPYKQPWPAERAFALIREGAGQHFDPGLTPLFLERSSEVIDIMARYGDQAQA